MNTIDELVTETIALDEAATPGAWEWFGNMKTCSCSLATTHSGRVFVLDFERWGMQCAQPRFRWPVRYDESKEPQLMYPLAKMPAECGPVMEVSYRADFVGIDHPDAKLIARYRTLAPALARWVQERLERDKEERARRHLFDVRKLQEVRNLAHDLLNQAAQYDRIFEDQAAIYTRAAAKEILECLDRQEEDECDGR